MTNLPSITPGSALSLVGGSGRLTRAERRAARSVSKTRLAGEIVKAEEAVKIDVIREVTQEALLAASDVSSMEAALVQRTPHAVGRLSYIADSGAQAMGNIVNQIGRRL